MGGRRPPSAFGARGWGPAPRPPTTPPRRPLRAPRSRTVMRVATRCRRRSRSRIGRLPPDAVLQRPQARLPLGGLLDPGRHGHQAGQGPRAWDGVLQLQRVRQRQLQDALQIRGRAEPRQGVGAPDRALTPAAQPPQPARLGGGLAGLGRVPEAGAARAQGRPFPLRARQAGRLAVTSMDVGDIRGSRMK